MKRSAMAALLCCILIFSFAFSAGAVEPRVVDYADVLSYDEESELEYDAVSLTIKYGIDVVLVVVDGLDGSSAMEYADDFYDSHNYGMDDEESGVLLLLDIDSRDWWISTKGKGIEALTDYGIQEVFGEAAPYFGDDEWFEGFSAYLDALPYYFDAYEDGHPIDILPGEKGSGRFGFWNILISILVGGAAAAIVVFAMKSSMDTTDNKRSAADYLDSYNLRVNTDMFLYSEVTKSAKPKESSSDGGGGSSTHESSSGDTHGGGGGSF